MLFGNSGMKPCLLSKLSWTLPRLSTHVAAASAQVGSYVVDQQHWIRPEQLNTTRPAFVVNNSRPGSDLLGSTAAALAASSLVFRPVNSSYAQQLVDTAVILYT